VAKFVKSNAIVYCGGGRTLGIGAGQMSRVDSTRIAAAKAKSADLSLAGSVAASDAFFPFRDGLDVVADNGAVAVIQPGGSMRDDEVIAAADERGYRDGLHRRPPFPTLTVQGVEVSFDRRGQGHAAASYSGPGRCPGRCSRVCFCMRPAFAVDCSGDPDSWSSRGSTAHAAG
jgi:hypothetical protein